MGEMIERVADAIHDEIGSQVCFYAGQSNYCVRKNGVVSRPCFCEAAARAAIEAMREPNVEMVAAAFPCEANEEFSHEDKRLGAAVCLKLGGAADVGLLEGEAVKQAAFLARDYRIMIDAALTSEQDTTKENN